MQSNTLIVWAERQNIILNFIQPGKPQQNAYIERYNRTVRYDWLGHYLFYSLSELQNTPHNGNGFYNHERPNITEWLHTNAAYSALI
jgi:putative transposase